MHLKIVTEVTYEDKMPLKNSDCTAPKKKSSKSKQGKGGGEKNINASQAKMSIPLGEDVKLHEAENPWRPARCEAGELGTEEDCKTEQLYKKVLRILNMLISENFDMLLRQMKALQIDNSDQLQAVIDLVFDKAVDEPEFSAVYAKMCKELALINVPIVNSCTAEGKEEVAYFHKILITKCEMEFEKHFDDKTARDLKLKEIDECTDLDKKKDLQIDLEDYDRELIIKSVGLVIFMSELFKQEMSASDTMVRYLNNLLENEDEKSLECLCIFLTTIGKELESNVDLTKIFNTMKTIAEEKENTKISSRIRFMLQDVIDFGQLKRVPPRQYLNLRISKLLPTKWHGRRGKKRLKTKQSDKLENKAIGPSVQLHETDNPIECCRRILKKLTLQNFDELRDQIIGLRISNSDQLQDVIDLVFEKAVDEPEFSLVGAKMCKELALMHVPMSNSSAREKKEELVNFRKILITRCQMEFEKHTVDESTRNAKLKEIEECSDPDKKKVLQFDLEAYDRLLRMRSVGNVRFIGELFKQEMITKNIILRCLNDLLEKKDEESLECLCQLLTIIGKELESKSVDLTQIFNTMEAIADKKENTKVSSRIRFMLQDLIDLRQSKWVPRRQDLNPKTIDQIQKKTQRGQRNTPRKNDRMSGGGGGGTGSMSLDGKGGRDGRNIEPGVQLQETDNPIEEARKTKQLYKKVRRILKKLTLQNFDELLGRIKSFQIDNSDRLQCVIDLLFDKAVDEPDFSIVCAKMCKELSLMHIPISNSSEPEKQEEFVNFRKILITKCQLEFEKQSVDESIRNPKLKEIDECTDPIKKKFLQLDLEEYDGKLRMKFVGIVRFIGELFKQEMLTLSVMVRCLYKILENKDEESVEYLCQLLTIVGKELESNYVEWVPRRQDLNPKTIDQFKKKAEKGKRNIEMVNSVPLTPRKDNRMGDGSMGSTSLDRKGSKGGRNVSDDGWVTNQRSRGVFTVQSDKLKNKAPTIDEPFGSMSAFQNWGKGSQGPKFESQQLTNTSNPSSALENNYMDSDKRLSSPRSKDPYSSKGPESQTPPKAATTKKPRSGPPPTGTFGEAVRNVRVAVIQRRHPDDKMNQEQAGLVQNAIVETMYATPLGSNMTPPQFMRTKWSEGVLWMTCANQATADWLRGTIGTMGKLWAGADLTVVDHADLPKRPRV